jgi:hypothetical protein
MSEQIKSCFKDRLGGMWHFEITVRHAKKVRLDTGVDLYHLADGKMEAFAALMEDPEKLVAVCYSLLEEQSGESQISPESFAGLLDGEALDGMMDAFVGGLCRFFPNPAIRRLLPKAYLKTKAAVALKEAKCEQALEQWTPEKIEELLDKLDPSQEMRSTASSTIAPDCAA